VTEAARALGRTYRSGYQDGQLDAFKFLLRECTVSVDMPGWLLEWLRQIVLLHEKDKVPPPEISGVEWAALKSVVDPIV
jgi:hypothetical protein